MSTTSVPAAHLPPLGVQARVEVGRELQATLIELIDLALVGKQLHWSVVGPLFRPLHLQLDELIDAYRELGDAVAGGERQRLERGPMQDQAVLREFVRRLAEAGERARTRMDRLGDLDAASQDVLTDVVRELEKQLWMVRAQLPQQGTAPIGGNVAT